MNTEKRPFPMNHKVILAVLIGGLFFNAISLPSRWAFLAMNGTHSACNLSNTSVIPEQTMFNHIVDLITLCNIHLKNFLDDLLQSSWFGPPIFVALTIQVPVIWSFVQAFYLPTSSFFYGVIAAYLTERYHWSTAAKKFVVLYTAITIAVAVFTFLLGLLVNG